jgi:hypothetical protein
LSCLAAAPSAHAADDRGGYMGGAFGMFEYKESPDIPFAVTDDTTQYQLFGGYRVSKLFGVEFGMARTQDIDSSFFADVPGLGNTKFDISAAYDIYTLKALGFLPFNLWSLFGGLGYQSATLNGNVDVQGFGTVGTVHDHVSGSLAAIGIQRDFNLDLKSISFRGEYTWYDFGKGIDAAGFTLGMIYRF